ncbi:MAG: hypothetical protein ACHRHE_20385 [Tepidisphaerales bacterium]
MILASMLGVVCSFAAIAQPAPTYPADLTVWPNATSFANSDPWIAANHDRIREMRPRVLLVNFSNEHVPEQLQKLAERIIKCIAEGSRYHGYSNPAAPAFLKYEVFKFVDLRDADRAKGNSRLIPLKDPDAKRGFNFKYKEMYSDEFAKHYAVPDPNKPERFLPLAELVDRGYVHEVWFFDSGNVSLPPHVGGFESIELKPVYDEQFRRVEGKPVQSGNGGDPEMPWTGRSIRIGFINASRGAGCFMESLSHSFEGTAYGRAIPYFTHYFYEYAGLDLNTRYKLPFNSLYSARRANQKVSYPDPTTMVVPHNGKEVRVENYVAAGGNVHFPPNGRADYDMDNREPVMSTIEDWRVGSGPAGKDVAKAYTSDVLKPYRELAPDCMGAWLIYWRQNIPGLDNRAKDDQGKPMKNWWPFLFY